MAKCKKCGEALPDPAEACPLCGTSPGIETITDLPGSGLKNAQRELKEEIELEREKKSMMEEAECRGCGEVLVGGAEICPKCGFAPGAQTITDLPRANIKEAHRKLKEEIEEIREQRGRGE
jgi:uncharacterized OB-fold protein